MNLPHFHLLVLVDVHIQNQLSLMGWVVMLHNVYFGITKSLSLIIVFHYYLCLIYHVRSHLVAFDKTHLLIQILLFALLGSPHVHLRHTRTCGKRYLQVDLFAYNAVSFNLYRREESVLPVALHCISYLITGKCDGLSYRKPRKPYQYIVFIVLYAFHGNSTNLQLTRLAVDNAWFHLYIVLAIDAWRATKHGKSAKKYTSQYIHLLSLSPREQKH